MGIMLRTNIVADLEARRGKQDRLPRLHMRPTDKVLEAAVYLLLDVATRVGLEGNNRGALGRAMMDYQILPHTQKRFARMYGDEYFNHAFKAPDKNFDKKAIAARENLLAAVRLAQSVGYVKQLNGGVVDAEMPIANDVPESPVWGSVAKLSVVNYVIISPVEQQHDYRHDGGLQTS